MDRINENDEEYKIAFTNYEMCHLYFNNDITNDEKTECNRSVYKTCTDCLKNSEKILLETINEIISIQRDIASEYNILVNNKSSPPDSSVKKKQLTNIVKRYKTTKETLMDSIELYKMYRIYIITEVLKLVFILCIIFYLLKTTKGVKTSTFISSSLYITISVLDVFYPTYMLFIFSALSFLTFVIFAIMNINDISINYQNIANKTTETFSNISTEFKKDVNVL